MSKNLLTPLLAVALCALPLASRAQQPGQNQADQTAEQIAQQNQQHEPHMAAALEDLRQAEIELEKAAPNKGGHREKAIQLTKEAMSQTE